ncbi:MAG: aldo/keto reductase [Dehalococcoidia bacterium]|nr:aldo/keto reductase [Dehalococcoidia bacterium]
MQYRQLGSSGLQVSAIGLGTNNFGRRLDAAATETVVHAALDAGVNMIDTSNSYGGGDSEEFIGRALKGRRHEAVLATKVSSRVSEGPNNAGNSRKHIYDQVDVSLRKLRTDYIDLYQIHWWDPNTPIEETLRALDELIRAGKVRYAGCSNFAAWQVCESHWTAKTLGINGFVSMQPHYSMLYRQPEEEMIPFCEKYGIGILPYYPLENGFLTGKYRRGQPAPDGTRLSENDRGALTSRNFDILEGLEGFASERGHTILELAFAWLLASPMVSSVIAGATRVEQVEGNAASAAWSLTAEEVEEVNAILG